MGRNQQGANELANELTADGKRLLGNRRLLTANIMAAKIIAIANNKGGIAKTTTAVNLGASLAAKGKRVLLVDYDPQSNLTTALRVRGTSIYNYLGNDKAKVNAAVISQNLSAVPSSVDLAKCETQFANDPNRNYLLSDVLEPLRPAYDFIIIDCAPNIGFTTVTALCAADGVIIPLTAEYLAFQGIAQLVKLINALKRRINPNVDLCGVLVVRYDRRKTLHREMLAGIVEAYGDKVFRTTIRENVALSECINAAAPVRDYAPTSNGAKDYDDAADELLKRLN